MSRSRGKLVLVGAALIVALPIGWYLLSPLFIDRVVQEDLPFVPAEATAAIDEALAEPEIATGEPMPADGMAGMRILAQGDFYDVAHAGHGRATVYELADGMRVLRFEDFEVLNGPDLKVWLVPIDPVPNTIGSEIDGYLDLGPLKGNIGDQNYDLPAGLLLQDYRSVVVWCQPFRVPFSAAALNPP